MRKRVAVRFMTCMAIGVISGLVAEQLTWAENGGYESAQGTRILGSKDPDLEGVLIPYDFSPDIVQPSHRYLRIDFGHLVIVDASHPSAIPISPTLPLPLVGFRPLSSSNNITSTQTTSGTPQATSETSKQVKLVVHAAQKHRNIYTSNIETWHDVWEYAVAVQDDSDVTREVPLCDGPNWALAIPGTWTRGQLAKQDGLGFTFSCVPFESSDSAVTPTKSASITTLNLVRQTAKPSPSFVNFWGPGVYWHGGGVSAKCVDYGYPPWVRIAKAKIPSSAIGEVMPWSNNDVARSFHNLCVQAMTADYWGDGRSHTISGTVISIFDATTPFPTFNGMQQKVSGARRRLIVEAAPTYNDLKFEGVWTIDLAGNAAAYCMARARWEAIDELDFPQESRNGPVFPQESRTGSGVGSVLNSPTRGRNQRNFLHCDDIEVERLVDLGKRNAVLVSYSAINERKLWRFKTISGWITTSHVKPEPDGSLRPQIGISCATPCEYEYLGDVLSPDAPVGNLGPLHSLYLYKNDNNDYATFFCDLSNSIIEVVNACLFRSQNKYSVMRSQFGPPSAVLEGYTFQTKPNLSASVVPLGQGAQARELQSWNHGEKYCTAAAKVGGVSVDCPGYHRTSSLGYLIYPDEPIRLLVSTHLLNTRSSLINYRSPPEPPDSQFEKYQSHPEKATIQPMTPATMQQRPQ